ncbi:MAG: leucine-rich repeat protein, partial [Prevotella sp.]|nr:leucine-rich repeat protein [Prevotella sp.]
RALAVGSGLTSVTIRNSVTGIGDDAFWGCSGLTSVTIPGCVTSIGYGAFLDCSGLTSVTIPNSVRSIGNYAFQNCSGLTSVTIPGSVTSIGDGVFNSCSGLTSVTIPGSVTSIGEWAFSGCSGLTSVTIPNSVTTIGKSAFEKCSKAESVKLPDNLQIIKMSTFKGCNSLKSVTIPSSVEYIYQEAFADCTGLESVKVLPETPPFLYANSFSNYNIPLYASKTAIAAYQAHDTWSKFAQFLTLDGQEVEVPQCATPTIDYANWKLTFSCATEGAEIVSEVTCSDNKKGTEKAVSLTPTYTITAYAKAEGYRDSEVVTATISWKDGRPVIIRGFGNVSLEESEAICDVNGDGKVNVGDIITIISTIVDKSKSERTE